MSSIVQTQEMITIPMTEYNVLKNIYHKYKERKLLKIIREAEKDYEEGNVIRMDGKEFIDKYIKKINLDKAISVYEKEKEGGSLKALRSLKDLR